ncbi:AAA family ATPase [Desulfobulbus rhabdoformis]|uniref:AAA family ATPase n=1 Tax=Desulfobulbus rhabdoformis TaxID=34032 RepID=UPI001962FD67|nr:AAA family ATPase [Desulfobulbus rhabdoformis]
MRTRRIVFVAGVHGVGKGYLCDRLTSMIDGEHVTASGLIKGRKELGVAKAISGIDANQAILVEELAKFKTTSPFVLLDGHFCLYNQEYEVSSIAPRLFKELNVAYIVMITCAPSVILNRLINRDKNVSNLSTTQLEKLQNSEVEHSRLVAEEINVPITFLDVSGDNLRYLPKLAEMIISYFLTL